MLSYSSRGVASFAAVPLHHLSLGRALFRVVFRTRYGDILFGGLAIKVVFCYSIYDHIMRTRAFISCFAVALAELSGRNCYFAQRAEEGVLLAFRAAQLFSLSSVPR